MPGLVPGIHVLVSMSKNVDGRDKPGHDGERSNPRYDLLLPAAAATGAGLSCFWNINNGRKMTRP
ncbi:hypothetical protein ABIF65_001329 [Bradyrhizobium japonicum]